MSEQILTVYSCFITLVNHYSPKLFLMKSPLVVVFISSYKEKIKQTWNLSDMNNDYLPSTCVIPNWCGCRPESGRSAQQPSHPYLYLSMAAHRLCMIHAVWGLVLPQIMVRHGAQNTSSENLQYTWGTAIINAPGKLRGIPASRCTSWCVELGGLQGRVRS